MPPAPWADMARSRTSGFQIDTSWASDAPRILRVGMRSREAIISRAVPDNEKGDATRTGNTTCFRLMLTLMGY
jgi:hypothetical protein